METGTVWAAMLALLDGSVPGLWPVVALSLAVTLFAVLLASLIGLPLGAALAVTRFPGRRILVVLVNALMGFPPVVMGLMLYLLLSRSGPLGGLGWLFTPKAMVLAQALLVLPIVIALTRQVAEDLYAEYADHLASLDLVGLRAVPTILWDARFSLLTTVLAGLGRASAEVGAVLIVGGNILGHTRTMTTAIALETSKGDLALALSLGLILIALTVLLNALAYGAGRVGENHAG